MAQYEHLPIYKKAFDLAIYFDKIVRNFSLLKSTPGYLYRQVLNIHLVFSLHPKYEP